MMMLPPQPVTRGHRAAESIARAPVVLGNAVFWFDPPPTRSAGPFWLIPCDSITRRAFGAVARGQSADRAVAGTLTPGPNHPSSLLSSPFANPSAGDGFGPTHSEEHICPALFHMRGGNVSSSRTQC